MVVTRCVCVSRSVMSDALRPHGLYIAQKAPLSMQVPRQEYWIGLPFPRVVCYLPDPGIEPGSPVLQWVSGIAGRSFIN